MLKPKKMKGLFALLSWKSGVTVSHFFFKSGRRRNTILHSCVCIHRHAEPQNWFNPVVGRGCIPLYLEGVVFHYIWKELYSIIFGRSCIPLYLEGVVFHYIWKELYSIIFGRSCIPLYLEGVEFHYIWLKNLFGTVIKDSAILFQHFCLKCKIEHKTKCWHLSSNIWGRSERGK